MNQQKGGACKLAIPSNREAEVLQWQIESRDKCTDCTCDRVQYEYTTKYQVASIVGRFGADVGVYTAYGPIWLLVSLEIWVTIPAVRSAQIFTRFLEIISTRISVLRHVGAPPTIRSAKSNQTEYQQ